MADENITLVPNPYTVNYGMKASWSSFFGTVAMYLVKTALKVDDDLPRDNVEVSRFASIVSPEAWMSHSLLYDKYPQGYKYVVVVDLFTKKVVRVSSAIIIPALDPAGPDTGGGEITPPPLVWKPIYYPVNTKFSVRSIPEYVVNVLTINNLWNHEGAKNSLFSIFRSDPIFGRMPVRGADRTENLTPDLTQYEDGEVPLDTPVTYCLVEHLPTNPWERPIVQRNLTPNPSFETTIARYDYFNRDAAHTSADNAVNIDHSWDGASIVNGAVVNETIDNIRFSADTDDTASLISTMVRVPALERYQVNVPIYSSLNRRTLQLRAEFWKEQLDGSYTDVASTVVPFFPEGPDFPEMDRVLTLNFFIPRGTTHMQLALDMFDDGSTVAEPGEYVTIPKRFTLLDQFAQDFVAGEKSVEIGPAVDGTELELYPGTSGPGEDPWESLDPSVRWMDWSSSEPWPGPAPAGAGSRWTYPLIDIPSVDAIVPETEYRVTINLMIVNDSDDSLPISWSLGSYYYGKWNGTQIAGRTWNNVKTDSYSIQETARVYLVALDATDKVLDYAVMGIADSTSWKTFSVYLTPPPDTVRFAIAHSITSYGSVSARSTTQPLRWRVDAVMLEHELFTSHRLPYLDGDIATEGQDGTLSGEYLLGQPGFITAWVGEAHNSASVLIPPANLQTCVNAAIISSQAGQEVYGVNCAAIHISDPMLPRMGLWSVYMSLDAWVHPARVEKHAVVNRYTPVPVNDMRLSATNTLTVMTKTLSQRNNMRRMLQSGRVLIVKWPMTRQWGESVLYISVDEVNESYISSDFSRPERKWTLPFQVVSRPVGYIPSSSYNTWDRVRTSSNWANWDELQVWRTSWNDLITDDMLDKSVDYFSPAGGYEFPDDTATTLGVTVPRLFVTTNSTKRDTT